MCIARPPAFLLLTVLVIVSVPLQARAELTRYVIGDANDVDPALHGPAFDLGGGGSDVDEAMQWVIDEVRGCSDCAIELDVVVLRSSGSDGYNVWFELLDGIDSVETFVITDRESSHRDDVVAAVRSAEIVFFAGGDQCNYVRFFKGTPVQHAVEAVVARGGGVGGTSAGLAIQGEVIYDACDVGSSKSIDALADPFHGDISLSRDFFRWQHLRGTITDTHFIERDRLGRLIVFMARQLEEEPGRSPVLGIGIDAKTSLVIARDGMARVMGAGPVYFLRGAKPAETVNSGEPLTWRDIELWVIPSGDSFNLDERPARSQRTLSVVDGVILDKPY